MRFAIILGIGIGVALILRHVVTPPTDTVHVPGSEELRTADNYIFESQSAADLAVDQWQQDMDAYLASAEYVG